MSEIPENVCLTESQVEILQFLGQNPKSLKQLHELEYDNETVNTAVQKLITTGFVLSTQDWDFQLSIMGEEKLKEIN
jgi:predicted transcriptional regulator